MSDYTQMDVARFKESEARKHSLEMRKANMENHREYQKEVVKNEVMLDRMRQDYDLKSKNLKLELENKLTRLRDAQEKILAEERDRLKGEVAVLREAHNDQVIQLKDSQLTEIERMNESHRNSLELAKQKYIKAKSKYES